MEKLRWIIIGMIVGFLLSSGINYICNRSTSISCNINGKYEYDNRHYLSIEKEVTPEEYIGYEIGDDYILEE